MTAALTKPTTIIKGTTDDAAAAGVATEDIEVSEKPPVIVIPLQALPLVFQLPVVRPVHT